MAQLEASSATVEEWHKKSLALVGKSNDALLTLIAKAFETIAVVLSQESDNDRVVRSIASLDFERTLALQFESKDFDVLRHLVFGLIESLQVSLPHLRRERSGVNEQLSSDEASNLAPSPLLTVKEEPAKDAVETTSLIPHDNQLPTLDFGDDMDFKEEEMKFELENVEPIVEDSLNDFSNREYSDIRDLNAMEDNSVNDFAIDADDVDGAALSELNGEYGQDLSSDDLIGEEKEKGKTDVGKSDTRKESSESVDDSNRRRSSRNAFKPSKYKESLDDSDEDVGVPAKKAKVDSSKGSVNSSSRKIKINDTELECPECEYRSSSVSAWYCHLRFKHHTTPALAGLSLLCACGHESCSDMHSRECNISKITVIRMRNGPIRRLDDEKSSSRKIKTNDTELECLECEYRSSSVTAWYDHLRIKHSTTPALAGLALLCACGDESSSCKHSLSCSISKIRVIRKRDGPIRRLDDEKTTPKCIFCEKQSKTIMGYCWHLSHYHKSTLKENGIYLTCSCGWVVRSYSGHHTHNKNCDGHDFTVHKVDDQ